MPTVHIVLLKFKPDGDVSLCMTELAGLKGLIPGLQSFTCGPNTSTEGLSKGYTHAFTMLFESPSARDAYLPHPEHERVKALIIQNIEAEGAQVFDYDI